MSVYNLCIGTPVDTTERILKENFGSEFPYDAVREVWEKLYYDHALNRPIDVKPGARALLVRLQTLAIPCALVTSTERSTAIAKLSHTDLEGYFAHMVCGGETARGKPHPDPYTEAEEAYIIGILYSRQWCSSVLEYSKFVCIRKRPSLSVVSEQAP